MKRVKNSIKFLFFPKYYHGKTYWLRWVKVTKHFNGYEYITTNIEPLISKTKQL